MIDYDPTLESNASDLTYTQKQIKQEQIVIKNLMQKHIKMQNMDGEY